MTKLRRMVKDIVDDGKGAQQHDLEQAMKSFLFNKTRRRPMVFVTMSRS